MTSVDAIQSDYFDAMCASEADAHDMLTNDYPTDADGVIIAGMTIGAIRFGVHNLLSRKGWDENEVTAIASGLVEALVMISKEELE